MNHLKEIRKQLKLNQTELGEIIGVAQTTIATYETGREIPENIILLLESKLYINREFLLKGSGEMFTPEVNEELLKYQESYREILKKVFDLNIEELTELNNYIEYKIKKS